MKFAGPDLQDKAVSAWKLDGIMTMSLNHRATSVVETLLSQAEELKVAVHPIEGGGRFVDCGIQARGGLLAGLELARVCLSDLARVSIVPGELGGSTIPGIQVVTDHPIRACLASQYAGWAIQDGKYFAMGSGPMRAAAGSEAIYDTIGFRESADAIVGVLETRKPPPPAIVAKIAVACRVEPAAVTLLAAPTASLAGGLQVVARSVETALHKLAELKFDLTRIVSAHGTAPLPPVADNDLAAIGWTNDSILYGARVLLYVTGDDPSLESIGPQVPSSASHDYGEPFAAIFARYHNDFYKVDPHLFSPAKVSFQNLDSGKVHSFGRLNPDVLVRSFGLDERASR
jgi:methenyltetrahydromethanopterin cyclohydrolase